MLALYEIHISQCIGKILCVEFHGVPFGFFAVVNCVYFCISHGSFHQDFNHTVAHTVSQLRYDWTIE